MGTWLCHIILGFPRPYFDSHFPKVTLQIKCINKLRIRPDYDHCLSISFMVHDTIML